MLTWRTSLAFSLILLTLGAASSAQHYYRSRPPVRCCIPDRDYQFKQFSQPARSFSERAVFLRDTFPVVSDGVGPVGLRPRVKHFQFVQNPRLQIDHCRLSRMSVLLHEDGRWTVSFRADQNPLVDPVLDSEPDVTTARRRELFTAHLLRNQFYVTVVCYGRYRTPSELDRLGYAVVVPLEMKPFWVQRRQPYLFFETGSNERIAEFFDELERVEIEFKYRTD